MTIICGSLEENIDLVLEQEYETKLVPKRITRWVETELINRFIKTCPPHLLSSADQILENLRVKWQPEYSACKGRTGRFSAILTHIECESITSRIDMSIITPRCVDYFKKAKVRLLFSASLLLLTLKKSLNPLLHRDMFLSLQRTIHLKA